MPTEYKVSFILDQSTEPDTEAPASVRDGGWTENYYLSAATLAGGILLCQAYAQNRARMLATTGAVHGFRIAERTSTGVARAYPYFRKGSSTTCDVPQMALQVHMRTGTSKRTVVLAGVPDARSIGGAYSPNTAYDAFIDRVILNLTQGFGMMAIDKTQPLVNIVSISTMGLVTTSTPHLLVANDKCRFFRTQDIYRQTIAGTWIVSPDLLTATTFQLMGYVSNGSTVYGAVTKGKVRKVIHTFAGFTEGDKGRITTRKVGRPTDQYVGRASRKRR